MERQIFPAMFSNPPFERGFSIVPGSSRSRIRLAKRRDQRERARHVLFSRFRSRFHRCECDLDRWERLGQNFQRRTCVRDDIDEKGVFERAPDRGLRRRLRSSRGRRKKRIGVGVFEFGRKKQSFSRFHARGMERKIRRLRKREKRGRNRPVFSFEKSKRGRG